MAMLLITSSAQAQVQAPDKAYIEQIPRNLRPAIPLPAPAQRPAAAAVQSQAAVRPAAAPVVRAAAAPAPKAPALAATPPVAQARPSAPPQPPPPPPLPRSVQPPVTGNCLIRVGTFSQRDNAETLAKTLKPLGEVRVNAMLLGGKPVHLVTVGGFENRRNAELALARLKASGRNLGALHISGCRS